jgi:Ca-activated chloride channel family protein
MGLRTYGLYGSRTEPDCRDTRQEVPVYRENAKNIKARLNFLKPNGTTPIAYSLTQAANDFPNLNGKNIIILITDGLEECSGDPCAVSASLQAKKVVLKPFVIGLNVEAKFVSQFECIGRFYNTGTEADFTTILNTVISQALNNTTLQVNLNNSYGKPTETDVNMTFYNQASGAIAYNYYHTLTARGTPDTFSVDPLLKYRIEVHTTPPVFIDNVTVTPGSHNTVKASTPQGSLRLQMGSNTTDIKCLVKESSTGNLVHVQDMNSTHKYLLNSYDLEILTLPRTYIPKVSIEQSKENKIEIPAPGKLQISSWKAQVVSVFIMRGTKQEWVTDLDCKGGEISGVLLQPGFYKIVYRSADSKNTLESKETDAKISSNSTSEINLP